MKKQENKSIKKNKSSRFKSVLKVIFVEDWGLKIMAAAFAVAVWIIFKASV